MLLKLSAFDAVCSTLPVVQHSRGATPAHAGSFSLLSFSPEGRPGCTTRRRPEQNAPRRWMSSSFEGSSNGLRGVHALTPRRRGTHAGWSPGLPRALATALGATFFALPLSGAGSRTAAADAGATPAAAGITILPTEECKLDLGTGINIDTLIEDYRQNRWDELQATFGNVVHQIRDEPSCKRQAARRRPTPFRRLRQRQGRAKDNRARSLRSLPQASAGNYPTHRTRRTVYRLHLSSRKYVRHPLHIYRRLLTVPHRGRPVTSTFYRRRRTWKARRTGCR